MWPQSVDLDVTVFYRAVEPDVEVQDDVLATELPGELTLPRIQPDENVFVSPGELVDMLDRGVHKISCAGVAQSATK